MICKVCGIMLRDHTLTCENCGAYLGPIGKEEAQPSVNGAASIRQGRTRRQGSASGSTGSGASRGSGYSYGSEMPGAAYANEQANAHSSSYESFGASRPDARSNPFTHSIPLPVNGTAPIPDVVDFPNNSRRFTRKKVNAARIVIVILVLFALGFAGFWYYNTKSDAGMSATARENTLNATEEQFELAVSTAYQLTEDREDLLEQWNKAEPRIYWNVANDYLEVGDIETAITCFRIASILEPDNYDGIMSFADTYQLHNEDDKAEQLYLYLIQDVSGFRKEAYKALVELYNDRPMEKAQMLQLAYENTNDINFALQRRDYVPSQPVINLTAGRYELYKDENGTTLIKGKTIDVNGVPTPINKITLTSPQGYDIYYTLDENAVLPEGGKKYVDAVELQDGYELDEGSVTIRAVCVQMITDSDEHESDGGEDKVNYLYSDEIKVTYTFYYPTPPAPKTNLAPNTYSKLKTVSLRPGEILDETMTQREKAEAEKHYTYYYTIDGSTPTTNSPRYDGNPITLPTGRVTLRAICVNQYGKSSSVLTIGYKFTVKPYLNEIYQESDQFSGFVLNKTDIGTFTSTFGEPKEVLETKYLNLDNEAQHLVYDWGYAVFILDGSSWVLVRLEMTSGFTTTPRGVKLGASEAEVCGAYKDYGQPENQDGTRGLYYEYPKVGSLIIRQDGTRVIQYTLETEASKMWVLQYWLNDHGSVNKICHYYQP